MRTTLHLEFYGWAWGGFKGCYQYTIPPGIAAAEVIANPKRFAGDFESVIDFRVVEETNEYEGKGTIKRRIDTFKTLRGFRNGMKPERFHRLINGGC